MEVLDRDGFDCLEATIGSYLRDDGVRGHVIKHSSPHKIAMVRNSNLI